MNLNDLFTEEKVRLDPKCWTGKKIGNPKTKMKGGTRVNNCVPAESVNEMDKSQTPPGRDGSNDPDAGKKEYTAKATTAKKVAKHGEKILNKVFNKKQGVAEGLAQDEAEEYSGWRAEFVNEINYNTFEVKLTNSRSKESANFIVRPVDMVSYGPTLSIETMDVHDLQTGQTESWTNDDPAPEGPIAYAISGLFYDDKQLQQKLQNIIDTHDTKGQDMMPGLEKRRSIGQEVDADAYIDSGKKTQAAMAKMKKGVAEKLGDNRPKLGSKRDAGKSIRKWRKGRGLDETGVAEGLISGVDAKGRTQQQWIRLVKAKYPDARIMQSKMIDGPCQAILSDGRKLSWIKVDNQSTEIDEASWNPTTGGDYPVDVTGREMVTGPSDQKWQAMLDYYNDDIGVRRALQDLADKNSRVRRVTQYVATFNNPRTNKNEIRYFPSKEEAYRWAQTSSQKITSIEKLDNDEITPPVTYNVILGVGDHRRMFKLTFASDEVAQKWAHDHRDLVKIQWNDQRDQYSPPTTPRLPDTYLGKIPGDETGQLDEKSVSQAQFRTMAAAAHNPKFAKKVGISQDVAREFNKADKGQDYKKLPARTTEESERGRGRPTTGEWDPTSGKVGRTEKTPTGIRHHADPSRYGGTEPDPEFDTLNKNTINAMDRALGVKWDRESKKYFSPLKVDMDEGEQKKGADYRDPPEADYGDDYQAMVARVKKLAGLGPMKTVYDPNKRVYRNIPTAVQPKK
jgi:hypothetical protein